MDEFVRFLFHIIDTWSNKPNIPRNLVSIRPHTTPADSTLNFMASKILFDMFAVACFVSSSSQTRWFYNGFNRSSGSAISYCFTAFENREASA